MATATEKIEVDYPASDGEPMGESGWHIRALFSLYEGFGDHYRDRGDVYVASNMFWYYQEGNPAANRCPDCMVIFGVGKDDRRAFKSWEEGAIPSVAFELSSTRTYKNDLAEKCEIYSSLGVPEYYRFDPTGECLDVPLLGYHLVAGEYEPVPLDPDGGLTRPILGLRSVPDGVLLRLVDPITARPIPTGLEKTPALEAATLDVRRANLRAEQSRLLADQERVRALEQTVRADAERHRADRREFAMERLKAEVDGLRAKGEGSAESGPKSSDQGS